MPSKVIEITDPQTGAVKETVVTGQGPELEPMQGSRAMQALGLGKYQSLREVATTSEFPALLRVGLKQIMFDEYNATNTTYQEWIRSEQSDKPDETWLEMNRLGTLPYVGEGDPYAIAEAAVDRAVRITNSKYGMRFAVTEEMLKFDKSNQIRQYATDMGEAAKQTIEAMAYGALTNSSNYTRNSALGDNDVGLNYLSSTALSATGLITAYTTIATTKDRKSGRYFNILPDTLVCTPSLEFSARMLLMAPELHRASAYTTAEVYGTGGANPFRGIVNRIIVSPWMGTGYQWVLMKAKKPVVFQEVEPLQLLTGQIDYQNNGSYFVYDRIEYRVREWFGMGMVNDRYAVLSGGTTPVVA